MMRQVMKKEVKRDSKERKKRFASGDIEWCRNLDREREREKTSLSTVVI